MSKKFLYVLITIVFILVLSIIGCSNLGKDVNLSNPAVLTQGISSESTTSTAQQVVPALTEQESAKVTEEQVVKDFRDDIAILFKAWKTSDITEFRGILEQGYSGNLLESKVKEAEPFIISGQGADVYNTNYVSIKVSKVEGNTATVDSEFSYVGYAYNTVNKTRGDKIDPITVKHVYRLELKNNRWYIVDETAELPNGETGSQD